MKRFTEAGIESDIMAWPTETGTDYFISNTHGSCAVQRKVAVSELVSELDDIMFKTIPAMKNFSDNPVLLIEENYSITQDGYLQNRADRRETQLLASAYFGYLETIRKLGVTVVTTRDLNSSIWWMIAMHGYLEKQHYPPHPKYFTEKEQAIGMLTAIKGIGSARAERALMHTNIRGMCTKGKIEGFTEKQSEKIHKILGWRGR